MIAVSAVSAGSGDNDDLGVDDDDLGGDPLSENELVDDDSSSVSTLDFFDPKTLTFLFMSPGQTSDTGSTQHD